MTFWINLKQKKFKTLIIDEENRLPRLKERLIKLRNGLGIKDDIDIYFMANQNLKFDYISDKMLTELKSVIDEINPDLIILDSMVRMMRGDENSSKDVRNIFDTIKKIGGNRAWILLHHTRKSIGNKSGVDIRGSGDFMAMCDEVLMINRKTRNEFILQKEKYRDGDEIDKVGFTVYNSGDGIIIENSWEEHDSLSSITDDLADKLYDFMKEDIEYKRNDFCERLKRPNTDSGVTSAISMLIKTNKLRKIRYGIYMKIV